MIKRFQSIQNKNVDTYFLRSRSSTAGLKLKPLEQKERNIAKQNFRRNHESARNMRVASILESSTDTSEDEAEILDFSNHFKTDGMDTKEDSGADEGLGSEIIDPKDVQVNIEETTDFLTKVINILGDDQVCNNLCSG